MRAQQDRSPCKKTGKHDTHRARGRRTREPGVYVPRAPRLDGQEALSARAFGGVWQCSPFGSGLLASRTGTG